MEVLIGFYNQQLLTHRAKLENVGSSKDREKLAMAN